MKYFFTNYKFQRTFGRYLRRKIYFSSNHTWESRECQMILKSAKKETPTVTNSGYISLIVSVSNIVVLLENQLLCSNYLFSITIIMQYYSKISIESVCQSSFSELPHEQYHLAYIHQSKTESQDYAFSYFL